MSMDDGWRACPRCFNPTPDENDYCRFCGKHRDSRSPLPWVLALGVAAISAIAWVAL